MLPLNIDAASMGEAVDCVDEKLVLGGIGEVCPEIIDVVFTGVAEVCVEEKFVQLWTD